MTISYKKLSGNSIAMIGAAAVALFLMLSFALRAEAGVECSAVTARGPVAGVLTEKTGTCSYLGIPYAAAPVGDLRFAMPTERAAWSEPLEATEHGSQCPQKPGPMTDMSIPMDEDCLNLNIWQPAGARDVKKPVMVYIHGGGFIVGSGSNDSYDGENLATYGDVVVVTINYRLGVLGFLVHPAFSDAAGRSGNWGLYDQNFALKWVKENISNFGGDPENVTLFGQSAGGMSVGYHLASPMSAGLFRNAIIHSGPPILMNVDVKASEGDGLRIAERLGCADPVTAPDCLRAVSVADIQDKIAIGIFIMDEATADNFFVQPVIDGKIIPDAPYKLYKEGKFNTDVHVMLGTTKDEASYFTMKKTLKQGDDFMRNYEIDVRTVRDVFDLDIAGEGNPLPAFYPLGVYENVEKAYQDFICDVGFTCPMEIMAELISARQPDTYRFYHKKAPFKIVNWGAFHGAELPYVFNNFTFMNQKFRSKDNLALSKKTIAFWTAFAKNGTPGVDGLPEWPKYNAADRKYMVLDDELAVESGLKADKCSVAADLFEDNFKTRD